MAELKTISFKFQFFTGDLLWTLAGVKQVCETLGVKADFYLWMDRYGISYPGDQHPYGGAMHNEYTYKMLRPLMEAQSYINLFQPWKGEKIIIDLDQTRVMNINLPYGHIGRWAGYVFPDMQADLSKPWIHASLNYINDQYSGKIIINRTGRYHNPLIHYWFLREIKEQLIFSGLKEEHEKFCKEWELDIPLLEVNDFLELAVAMKSCKFFIGNQSMCFALAEALKIPRILEVCPTAPNVITCGPGGYDFHHQSALEWMVKDVESPFNKL